MHFNGEESVFHPLPYSTTGINRPYEKGLTELTKLEVNRAKKLGMNIEHGTAQPKNSTLPKIVSFGLEYQPSGAGGTHSPPESPHSLQNPKWPPGAPEWPTGSGKVSTPGFLGILSNFC